MATDKSVDAKTFLEGLVGPLTFGGLLQSIRKSNEISQAAFARKLGISRQNLCDIEKGRTSVSPGRAARWAKVLGYHEAQFAALALQALALKDGFDFEVTPSTRKHKHVKPLRHAI